jgi:hypothetical protein
MNYASSPQELSTTMKAPEEGEQEEEEGGGEEEEELEEGGGELRLNHFQHSLCGDSPLHGYYMQLCSNHSGADRYALVCLIATEVGVWPRKAKSSRAVLEGDKPEEKLQEFFAEVFKKIAPKYGSWKMARVEKGKFSFDDFITTLDVFYATFVVKSLKDGLHFMCKGTEKYRAKYDLKVICTLSWKHVC